MIWVFTPTSNVTFRDLIFSRGLDRALTTGTLPNTPGVVSNLRIERCEVRDFAREALGL